MRKIQSALISVFHKQGLEPILRQLDELGVKIYSTGGTYRYIAEMGVEVHQVEDLTGYPSILDGRVKNITSKGIWWYSCQTRSRTFRSACAI